LELSFSLIPTHESSSLHPRHLSPSSPNTFQASCLRSPPPSPRQKTSPKLLRTGLEHPASFLNSTIYPSATPPRLPFPPSFSVVTSPLHKDLKRDLEARPAHCLLVRFVFVNESISQAACLRQDLQIYPTRTDLLDLSLHFVVFLGLHSIASSWSSSVNLPQEPKQLSTSVRRRESQSLEASLYRNSSPSFLLLWPFCLGRRRERSVAHSSVAENVFL
jgi:hypothetical protein